MSEVEQEEQPSEGIMLPVEWHVPDAIQAYIRAYHAFVPMRTIEEEEAEEQEWQAIISKPHVQQALRRMAAEARRQYYAGETEEGGFAIE
jgi:hypothetical protein